MSDGKRGDGARAKRAATTAAPRNRARARKFVVDDDEDEEAVEDEVEDEDEEAVEDAVEDAVEEEVPASASD